MVGSGPYRFIAAERVPGARLVYQRYKRLPDDQTWEKKGHKVTLWVEPGRMKVKGHPALFGVPYGARLE